MQRSSLPRPQTTQSFHNVLFKERDELRKRKANLREKGIDVSDLSVGVCFSGGGIRSANMCLGMLWQLAERDLLPEVSYISSVSGGAYASSALASSITTRSKEFDEAINVDPQHVHRWYRSVAAATILRFQENSNHMLQPFKWIKQVPCVELQRAVGLFWLSALIIFILILHPLALMLFIMVPLLMYFHTFHTSILRYSLCAPPYSCRDDKCTNIEQGEESYAKGTLEALGYDNALACIVAVIAINIVVALLYCTGLLPWLGKEVPRCCCVRRAKTTLTAIAQARDHELTVGSIDRFEPNQQVTIGTSINVITEVVPSQCKLKLRDPLAETYDAGVTITQVRRCEGCCLRRQHAPFIGRRWWLHFLHGLQDMSVRLFIIVGCAVCLCLIALYSQHVNFGTVGEIWYSRRVHSFNSTSTAPGWDFEFDFERPLEYALDQQPGQRTVRFETWYTCYNYTMSRWQARGWLDESLPVAGAGIGSRWHDIGGTWGKKTRWHDIEYCADMMDRRVGTCRKDDRKYGPPAFYGDCSFGRFYWGGDDGVGSVPDGHGPRNMTRRAFYQKWFDTCQSVGQIMCFAPTGGSPWKAGCCQSTFPFIGTIGLIGVCLLALGPWLLFGTTAFLKMSLLSAGPVLALMMLAFVLHWRAFGPITQAPSATGMGEALIGLHFPYTFDRWQNLILVFSTVAMLLLPFFDLLQRMVHIYFRNCLVNAYYHEGAERKTLQDCALTDACPVLLFGSTILMHRTSYDQQEAFGQFCMSTYHFGSPRTQYFDAPPHFEIARAMGCSGAAIDTAILTNADSWGIRFWMLSLNLMQGDWLRLLPTYSCLKTNVPARGFGITERFLDALPGLLIFEICFGLALLAEHLQSSGKCQQGANYMAIAYLIQTITFMGIFFMPMWYPVMFLLQPSPLVRMMQMAFIATPATYEEPPPYVYLGDGGLLENSGCLELLRRQVRCILVMEVGDDSKLDMIVLHQLIKFAEEMEICSFFDPEEPRRGVTAKIRDYQRNPDQTFLDLGILYNCAPDAEAGERIEGRLFWVQNRSSVALTEQSQWDRCRATQGPSERVANRAAARPLISGAAELDVPPMEQERDAITRSLSHGVPQDLTMDVRLPEGRPPLSELKSFCWGGRCCFPCGTFPNVATVNQFYSPAMASNFIHHGYHLSSAAVDKFEAMLAESKRRRQG